jgi:hypothetical protein
MKGEEKVKKVFGMMIMLLGSALALLATVSPVFAVTACPEPYPFTQPGGTIIVLTNYGDEFLNWVEDVNGNLVIFDKEKKAFCYAGWTDKGAVSSGEIIGMGSAAIMPLPRPQGHNIPQAVIDAAEQRRADELFPITNSVSGFTIDFVAAPGTPPVITPVSLMRRKMLMVHVTWADRSNLTVNPDGEGPLMPKLTGKQIYDLCFGLKGQADRSVNGYYQDLLMSSGAVIVPGEVLKPLDGYQGVIEVELPGKNPDPGQNGSAIMQQAIIKACADGQVNLAQFDTNQDGILSTTELAIGFIVDGWESSIGSNTPGFWGVSTSLTPAASATCGAKISSFFGQGAYHRRTGNIANDMLTVGIIAHEMGHSGYSYQDTYDYGTLTGSNTSAGHGYWSLQGQGSWARKTGEYSGATPGYQDAYNLVRSGHLTPGVLADGATAVLNNHLDIYIAQTPITTPQVAAPATHPYGTQYGGQFFLIQQRKYGSADNYDQGAFDSISSSATANHGGMLLFHVDMAVSLNRINDKPTHMRAGIEEAHGGIQNLQVRSGTTGRNFGDLNDLWGVAKTDFNHSGDPGSGTYSAFTNNLTPPTQTASSDISIAAISWNNTAKTTSFTIGSGTVDAPPPIINTHPQGAAVSVGAIYNLTVSANSPDGGSLSYQWYRNTANNTLGGTAVGTDSPGYTPSTAAVGTFYYYVTVTNTNNNANGNKTAIAISQVAAVVVSLGDSPAIDWVLKAGTNSRANTIIGAGEVHTYKFTAPVSGIYTFSSTNKAPTLIYLDPYLYNSAGSLLSSFTDGGTGFNFTYGLNAGEVYYLKLGAYLGTGAYTINITVPAIDWALSAEIDSKTGVINVPKEEHMYKFTAPVSGIYKFSTSDKAPTLTWLDGFLYNSGGTLLASQLDAGAGISFTCSLTAGQVYCLKLEAYSGYGTYTINIAAPAQTNYTVSYNYSENGGTYAAKTTATLTQGAAVDLTPAAGKSGWLFVGWNTDKEAITGLESLNMGTSDLILFAIFKKELAATFIDYNGSSKSTRTIEVTIYNKAEGGSIETPSQSGYNGWTSRGWGATAAANAAVTAASGADYPIYEDTTFFGLYQRILTLSYHANGGWDTPAAQTGTQYANSYAITNFSNPSFILAEAINRTNYNFCGWALGSAGGTVYDAGSSITIAENTAMYATWGNKTPIDWVLSAGVNSKAGVINAEKEEHMYKFTAPSSGTYSFSTADKASTLIWLDGYLYNSGGALLISKLDIGSGISFTYNLTAEQTYYLKLEGYSGYGAYAVNITVPGSINYTVTYNYSENGGTSAAKTTAAVAQGAAVDLTPTAAKSGWVFMGWNTNKNAVSGLTSLNMGTADLILFAIFKKDLVATFIDYNGSSKSTRTAGVTIYNKAESGNIMTPSQFTYSGWTSRGWSAETAADSAITVASGANYPISGDTTFFGLYQRILTLSYNANGGSSAPAAQTGTQYANSYAITTYNNPSFTLAGAITRTGYSFCGWALGSAGGAIYVAGSSITIAENTTMYAAWEDPAVVDWLLTTGINSKTGVINAEKEAHMYRFTAPGAGVYTFSVSGKASTLTWLDGYLYNSGGTLLTSKLDSGSGISFSYSLTAGQTYYLKLEAYAGKGAYTISITF